MSSIADSDCISFDISKHVLQKPIFGIEPNNVQQWNQASSGYWGVISYWVEEWQFCKHFFKENTKILSCVIKEMDVLHVLGGSLKSGDTRVWQLTWCVVNSGKEKFIRNQ